MAIAMVPQRLALPRSYFEVMTEGGIVVVYRGRVYTPLVAPSPEQLEHYGQASVRLSGLVFALEPMERLAALEQRYFNGRSLQPALQQYQQDYLATLGGQMVSADLQDEILSVALKRFVTDEIFPAFATSQRTLNRLLGRRASRVAQPGQAAAIERARHDDDGDDQDTERVRHRRPRPDPPDEDDSRPPQVRASDSTRILRDLLRHDSAAGRSAEPTVSHPQVGSPDHADAQEERARPADYEQPAVRDTAPADLGNGSAGVYSGLQDQVLEQYAGSSEQPATPPESGRGGAGTQGYERNFARLLRHTTTTRTSQLASTLATQQSRPLSRPVNPPAGGDGQQSRPDPPPAASPNPSTALVRSGEASGGRVQPREQQRGLSQPQGIVSAAPQVSDLSIVERMLGLTDFAVVEGVIYAMQPVAAAARPDVQVGGRGLSLRPYASLAEFLGHYNTRLGESLRREGVTNQPVIQQLRRDRQHVEEALKLNYGTMGLSILNINSRSCFVCMEVPPFANRGSDGKFYYFAAPMMREFARRAGQDVNQVQEAIRVAIQVSINWSARGFEKITAGEPLMLGSFKGPFVTWARELTVGGGFVYNRDICTENYQPPSHLSFGAGIANKLEAGKRITMSGYILGAVRPRSLLNTEGYSDFQVELGWLQQHGIQVTNVAT